MKSITTGARLIAKMQPLPVPTQTSHQFDQDVGAVLNHPIISDIAASPILGYRYRYRRLVHIQSDATRATFHLARLPCMRL